MCTAQAENVGAMSAHCYRNRWYSEAQYVPTWIVVKWPRQTSSGCLAFSSLEYSRWPKLSSRHAQTRTYVYLHVQCPLFLSDFGQNWNVSTYFSEDCRYQISLKFVQREIACWQTTDGQGESNKGDICNLSLQFPIEVADLNNIIILCIDVL
jgi:hypothetical protein